MSRWIAPKVGDLVRYRGVYATGAVYLVSSVTKNGVYVGLVGVQGSFNMNSAALEVVGAGR